MLHNKGGNERTLREAPSWRSCLQSVIIKNVEAFRLPQSEGYLFKATVFCLHFQRTRMFVTIFFVIIEKRIKRAHTAMNTTSTQTTLAKRHF